MKLFITAFSFLLSLSVFGQTKTYRFETDGMYTYAKLDIPKNWFESKKYEPIDGYVFNRTFENEFCSISVTVDRDRNSLSAEGMNRDEIRDFVDGFNSNFQFEILKANRFKKFKSNKGIGIKTHQKSPSGESLGLWYIPSRSDSLANFQLRSEPFIITTAVWFKTKNKKYKRDVNKEVNQMLESIQLCGLCFDFNSAYRGYPSSIASDFTQYVDAIRTMNVTSLTNFIYPGLFNVISEDDFVATLDFEIDQMNISTPYLRNYDLINYEGDEEYYVLDYSYRIEIAENPDFNTDFEGKLVAYRQNRQSLWKFVQLPKNSKNPDLSLIFPTEISAYLIKWVY